ncbi:hypothetical protein V1517DRAFT_331128 [Lipomyces orientalis]|uniref:Uncharacterized protein n=1 Tax=Lipomyces orientalis TaxID=1233043 RepID=A0ACC3TFD6_9ASCO
MLATIIQVFTTAGAITFLMKGIPDLCSFTQASRFVCTFPHTLYSETLLQGVVGPNRTFNGLYPVLKYAFLMGVFAAVPAWAIRKRFRVFEFVDPGFLPALPVGAVLIISHTIPKDSTYHFSSFFFLNQESQLKREFDASPDEKGAIENLEHAAHDA